MIVVTLTSWIKRIRNVKNIVENIMKNTLQPDKIYLSLSVEEFSNKEMDLPKDLVDYFNSDERLIINWVEGENTKCMKKVFPILKYLDDNDIIIPIDDDIMYPLDYIEKRVDEYESHLQPISGLRDFKSSYIYKKYNILCNIGHSCLFTKKMMNHWEEYVDDKILKSNNDDTCYAMLEWLNGYTPQTCDYYGSEDIAVKCVYNEVEPSGKLKRYTNGKALVSLHNERIKEITNTDYKNSFNFYNYNNVNNKIVVTMTSWTKRIGNVKKVVESIMNNSVKPDKVYLNLSKMEFEGIDLPKDLVDYFNSDERLIINWVEGENTKSMKKVFPTLKYLNDNDIIITADDDILFPSDLIESRVNDFNKYKNSPITSNESKCGIGEAMVISPLSLYQKKMFNNWEKYVNEKVIHTYNDDRTYLYILYLNGYIAKPSSNYHEKYLKKNFGYNEYISPMKGMNIYPVGKKYDEIVKDDIYKLTGTSIMNSFGFFKNKKYDCVMPYHKIGVDSKEMTCGKYFEIEYVISSLKKYCSSWVGRIFIVGSEPPERIKNDVIHIQCDNPYTHCKDANIIHKLRYACENIKDLTEDFLMISDDQIVTKESSWVDMKPRIVRKFDDWSNEKWEKNRKLTSWHECLYNTLKLFPSNKSCFWEPHIWSPMNKYKFIEMCKKYDYKHRTDCIAQTLYYNFIDEIPIREFDHLHISSIKSKEYINSISLNKVPRHISWTDVAFSDKKFRDVLDIIVGFDKNINNKDKKYNKVSNSNSYNKSVIQTIREDLKNGNLVKINKPDGTFIWKRIKK